MEQDALLDFAKLLGGSGFSAMAGGLVFYFLKRKIVEESTATARAQAEGEIIQNLRAEIDRLNEINAKLMQKNYEMAEMVNSIKLEAIDLKIRLKDKTHGQQ